MKMGNMFDPQVPASLSTICNGEIEEMFHQDVQALLSQLQHGQKASLTITLDFSRIPNTDSMITVAGKVKPTFPARTRKAVGQLTKDCVLKVDKPTKVVSLSLLDKASSDNE